MDKTSDYDTLETEVTPWLTTLLRYIQKSKPSKTELANFLRKMVEKEGDIELPDADKRFDNRNIKQQKWDMVDALLRPIINDILLKKHVAASLSPMQYMLSRLE